MSDSQLSPHHADPVRFTGPHGQLAGLRAAPGSPIATVLLVPGYTGSKEDFAPLLDPCAGAGFDTITVDLPGQHESPGPDDESAYLPDQLGTLVAKLATELADGDAPVILLGHSYGGLVARAAVLAGAPVAGLTLMDSGPACLPEGHRRAALIDGEPLLRTHGTTAAYQVREAVSARNPAWAQVPAALKDFLRARFIASNPACLLGMAEGLRSEPDRVDELATTLDTTGLPCLVVSGEHDDAWGVPSQRAMAERLRAPFASIPGAIHSPNTENPGALLDVLLPTWRSWVRRG